MTRLAGSWQRALRSLSTLPAVAVAANISADDRWVKAVPSRMVSCSSKPASLVRDIRRSRNGALPLHVLAPDLVESLERALTTKGTFFDIEFHASKSEFDDVLLWSWAKLGFACSSPADYKPRAASTADSANRRRDKQRVESNWGLYETGNSSLEFYDSKGEPIARGYEAIVYGDHGPYIEFKEEQIYWPTFCRHKLKGPGRTHFEHYNRDVSIKLYGQFKTVADQPNPPADSNPFACSNNRPEGYADYRPGRLYMSADALFDLFPPLPTWSTKQQQEAQAEHGLARWVSSMLQVAVPLSHRTWPVRLGRSSLPSPSSVSSAGCGNDSGGRQRLLLFPALLILEQRGRRQRLGQLQFGRVRSRAITTATAPSVVTLKLAAAEELERLKASMKVTPAAWAEGVDSLAHVRRHCQTLLFLQETYRQVQQQLPSGLTEAARLQALFQSLAEQCKEGIETAKAILGRSEEDFIFTPKYYYSELRLRRNCLLPQHHEAFLEPQLLSFLATEVVALLRMQERCDYLAKAAGREGRELEDFWTRCVAAAHNNAVELTVAMMQSFSEEEAVRELHSCFQEEQLVCTEVVDGSTGRVRFGSSPAMTFDLEDLDEEDDDEGDGDFCSTKVKPIFVVSDCTGESAERTVLCALGQFGHCFERDCPADVTTFRFATAGMMEDIARRAKERNAFVVYTLVDPVANAHLQQYCQEQNVESHDLWSPLLEKLEGYFDASRLGIPGRRQFADASYMRMIECIEYTRLFDDGVQPHRWAEADLMIIGPSRSGKTPLAFFMAQRGYKVANYPLIPDETIPEQLWSFPQDRIFALKIDPKKLARIRPPPGKLSAWLLSASLGLLFTRSLPTLWRIALSASLLMATGINCMRVLRPPRRQPLPICSDHS
ncbi:PDRP1 [Symbiodinium necroappetens]|uniref:PDRP1 protein n=1 Tax=Symbiodinium necroappetens TaxID=1628268 RepID=A0A813AH80_9DINO|nr:PDRP1 [Symbiodinium necroappetens]